MKRVHCDHCHSTGSLSRKLDGFLDCAQCDNAQERVTLDAWARDHGIKASSSDLWLVYVHGRTAGVLVGVAA